MQNQSNCGITFDTQLKSALTANMNLAISCYVFFLVFHFLGGIKKVVAAFDVHDGNLILYNDSFEWEGMNYHLIPNGNLDRTNL